MFTGIISATAKVTKAQEINGSLFLTIQKPGSWQVRPGDSIAVNGVCLTAKKITSKAITFELMPETLKRTSFGVQLFNSLNLEQPLRLKDFISGHLVQGHVDAVGKITAVKNEKDSKLYTIQFPAKFSRLLVDKGSIAVDGISLTVLKSNKRHFSVSLVSYTLENTTIQEKQVGDVVNLEFDIVAKYLMQDLKK